MNGDKKIDVVSIILSVIAIGLSSFALGHSMSCKADLAAFQQEFDQHMKPPRPAPHWPGRTGSTGAIGAAEGGE